MPCTDFFTGLRSVLCVGAHPDDIEIGCGGTLLELLRQSPAAQITWCVLSGQGRRREEAEASATRYLAQHDSATIELKQFRDSFFPYQGAEIKEYFQGLAARLNPELIFTHRLEDRHQDHRLVAELTWNAFRQQTILEYEIPKYEGDLGHPTVYVPLSQALCEQKIAFLGEDYATQQEKSWFTESTFWALLRLRGMETPGPAEYAEAFTCRKLMLGTVPVRPAQAGI